MTSFDLGTGRQSYESTLTTKPPSVQTSPGHRRLSLERVASPFQPLAPPYSGREEDHYSGTLRNRSALHTVVHLGGNEAGPSHWRGAVDSRMPPPSLKRARTDSFELGKPVPQLQTDLELGEGITVPELTSYPPRQTLRFAAVSNSSASARSTDVWYHKLTTVPLALFKEDQRHNLWLTMSIIGRVLYGFGPVLIVQRFQQMQQPGSPSPAVGGSQGHGGPGGPGGGPAPYMPLGIAWPAAVSVIGAGFGFAASIGNWNDGKKINRRIAYRNWTMHNAGIILQLAGHFITPLAQQHLQGPNKLVAFFPQALSAGCLWMTIPASYAASASTRTLTISEAAVARRLELCNWVRAAGGLFMTIWFASYVVSMHPLAVETFNIVGVLSVLLSFSMLMIPLRVITAKPKQSVIETAEQRAWADMIWRGGIGLYAAGAMTPGGHLIDPESADFAEAVEMYHQQEALASAAEVGNVPLTRTMTI